jgi:hypothetical protein
MKETTKENAAAATPATIQRRRRPKRRSTGVVQIDMEVYSQPHTFHSSLLLLPLLLLPPTAFTPAPHLFTLSLFFSVNLLINNFYVKTHSFLVFLPPLVSLLLFSSLFGCGICFFSFYTFVCFVSRYGEELVLIVRSSLLRVYVSVRLGQKARPN